MGPCTTSWPAPRSPTLYRKRRRRALAAPTVLRVTGIIVAAARGTTRKRNTTRAPKAQEALPSPRANAPPTADACGSRRGRTSSTSRQGRGRCPSCTTLRKTRDTSRPPGFSRISCVTRGPTPTTIFERYERGNEGKSSNVVVRWQHRSLVVGATCPKKIRQSGQLSLRSSGSSGALALERKRSERRCTLDC